MLKRVYARYFVASAAALAVDGAVFLISLKAGIQPMPAAAAGYLAGLLLHWLLSSRAVFVGALAARGTPRQQQQAMFFGSALVGLAITTAIVGMGSAAGLDPRIAKAVAIAVSFQITYLLRKRLVFA